MRILIEGYTYTITGKACPEQSRRARQEDLRLILKELGGLQDVEHKVMIDYVGYYYSAELKDCVFILPKVLITVGEDGKEKAFGEYDPADIICVDKDSPLTDTQRRFIYEFAVWIYRAIDVYRNKNKKNGIIYYKHIAQMGNGRRRMSNTFLDVLLSLIQFNKDNQDFLFFTLRNIHSGFNKINWTRTIAKSNAIIQDECPIYLNPVNKKRQINFDEELLVIFFSILNYINEKYGFSAEINVNFPLIPKQKFETYLKGRGKARLHQIKYKYFSDKALRLWEYCYAFFDKAHQINISSELQEYLLAKDFNIVFEAIIDDLIGDELPKKYKPMKEQQDGKLVDHMYSWYNLTTKDKDEEKKIFYIGDSKYYKRTHDISKESWYKQFTYARNVIQWNLDLFLNGKNEDEDVLLRDEVTEGYNIIPNFFISATLDDKLSYKTDIYPTERSKKFEFSRQFENRLFDRDSLLVSHYDVNFLYVVALYARQNRGQKEAWKVKVRDMFRSEIQAMLEDNFSFMAITAHEDVNPDEYIRENFQQLIGKLFKPFEDRGDQQYFSLALRRPEKIVFKDKALQARVRKEIATENEGTKRMLEQYFYMKDCPLGTDPQTIGLPEVMPTPIVTVPKEFRTRYHLQAFMSTNFLIGCYKGNDHLGWIFGMNGKRDWMYNVRLGKREGAMSEYRAKKQAPKFVLLYKDGEPIADDTFQFRIHNAASTPYEFMVKTGYPNPSGDYLSWILESEPITFGTIDIPTLLSDYKKEHPDYVDGAPIYILGKDLIQYLVN